MNDDAHFVFLSTLALIPSIPEAEELRSESIILATPVGLKLMLVSEGCGSNGISGRSQARSLVNTEQNAAFRAPATLASGTGHPKLSSNEIWLDCSGLIVLQKRFGSVCSIDGNVLK